MEELEKLNPEQQAVLVHEAGHVAMAISLRLTPVEVLLAPKGKGVAVAFSESKGFSVNDKKHRIAVLMAGYLAEREYKHNHEDHGTYDRDEIKNIVTEDCIDDADRKRIEDDVIQFLSNNFQTKILRIAELLASNYRKDKLETLSSDLEAAYRGSPQT